MFGQLSVVLCEADPLEVDPLEEDVPDDALAEGLDVAACAIAAPPPTRAPESARATTALLSVCRMSLTSSRSLRPVKRRLLGAVEGTTEEDMWIAGLSGGNPSR
jgi:hypothetical protein